MRKSNVSRKTLGTNYYVVGWGYRVLTLRGWITVDTEQEVEEELNLLLPYTRQN